MQADTVVENRIVFNIFAAAICFLAAKGAANGKCHFSSQFRRCGKLIGFQFSGARLQSINPTAQGGQLGSEFVLQFLQNGQVFFRCQIGGGGSNQLADAVKAGVQPCGKFVAAEGAVALVGAVGIACNAAVAFHQRLQGLKRPISRLHVGQLGNRGNLIHPVFWLQQGTLSRLGVPIDPIFWLQQGTLSRLGIPIDPIEHAG